jgi:hypothetical protein
MTLTSSTRSRLVTLGLVSALALGAGAVPASLAPDAKAGTPAVSELVVTKYMDKASSDLAGYSSHP